MTSLWKCTNSFITVSVLPSPFLLVFPCRQAQLLPCEPLLARMELPFWAQAFFPLGADKGKFSTIIFGIAFIMMEAFIHVFCP